MKLWLLETWLYFYHYSMYIHIYIKNIEGNKYLYGFYTTCRAQRKFETSWLKVKINHVHFWLACKHTWKYFEENCWRIYFMLFYMLLKKYSKTYYNQLYWQVLWRDSGWCMIWDLEIINISFRGVNYPFKSIKFKWSMILLTMNSNEFYNRRNCKSLIGARAWLITHATPA